MTATLASSDRISPLSVLRDALRHTPRLRQLKLLLPSFYDDENELRRYTSTIRAHLPPSTIVRARTGDDIGVDEGEFWEAPVLCDGNEGDAALCRELSKL